jgi:hypothetical protein
MANRTATLTARLIDDISGPAKGAAGALKGLGASAGELNKLGAANPKLGKLLADLERLKAAQKGIGDYRDAGRSWMDLGKRLRSTQDEIKQTLTALDQAKKKAASFDGVKGFARGGAIAKEMADARKEVVRLESTYKNLQRDAAGVAAAFEKQGQATRGLKAGLLEAGVSLKSLRTAESGVKAAIDATTSSIERQANAIRQNAAATDRMRESARAQLRAAVESGKAQRRERQEAQAAAVKAREHATLEHQALRDRRLGAVGATAGIVGGYKAKEFGVNAINQAADMDIAVRKQRIATDVTEAMQNRLLIPQAKRIGQDTQYSNIDIVKAQTATMQSLPFNDADLKAEIGAGIIGEVKNYAQIMEADMTRSAEGLRSFLQTTNKDISSKEKAIAEATRGTNLLVKMAKRGGMSDDDVQAFVKFGFPTATQAGFTDTTTAALGSVGRRGGLRGDELGVFVRAAASKLIAPTQKGREAEIAAGIDRDKYTRMPGGLSTDTLEKFQKNRFGKSFSDDQRARITGIIQNEDTGLPEREDFITQISAIVSESFDKTKKGKTKAQDAQKIAKMVGDFYKMSVESTDIEGLLREHLANPRMTPALRNAFWTDKHGGKMGVIANKSDQLREDKAELDHVTQDPGFAARKAVEIMAGMGGSLNQLKGAVETLTLSFGEANSSIAKSGFDKLSGVAEALTALPDGAKQAATALAAVGATYGAVKGVQGFLGGFGLAASATALDGSAAALTAAAVKLGATGGLPDVPGGASKGGKAGRFGKLGGLGFIGAAGLGVGAVALAADLLDQNDPHANRANGYRGGRGRPNLQSYPSSWGAGGTNVSAGMGVPGGGYSTNRPKTWNETLFGGTATFRGGRDPTKVDLPIPASMGNATPKVDVSSVEAVKPKADEAKAAIEGLNVTATPNIVATSIMAANAAVLELLGNLNRVPGAVAAGVAAATAGAAKTGNVAQRLQNARTDTGM